MLKSRVLLLSVLFLIIFIVFTLPAQGNKDKGEKQAMEKQAEKMSRGKESFESDLFDIDGKKLEITFIGHGTLMFNYNGIVIHVDPTTREADYSTLPKADIILITHQHGDHFDPGAIALITKSSTKIVVTQTVFAALNQGIVMKNGDSTELLGIGIKAVPAYNTTAGREKFHPKGRDNGYILSFGTKRVYIAGDTEFIPEMSILGEIFIAFLPMNQPNTMLPEQAAEAARVIMPQILYPYHFGETDPMLLVKLLEDTPQIKVRIRALS